VTPAPLQCLDLRGIPCPQNYVRTRLALETLPPQGWLQVDLDAGEPGSSVAEGLRGEGHLVLVEHLPQDGARLLIQRAP
jgi:TusA-related sulfurtransferase